MPVRGIDENRETAAEGTLPIRAPDVEATLAEEADFLVGSFSSLRTEGTRLWFFIAASEDVRFGKPVLKSLRGTRTGTSGFIDGFSKRGLIPDIFL